MARELSGRYVVVQWKCVGMPSVPLRISLTNAFQLLLLPFAASQN